MIKKILKKILPQLIQKRIKKNYSVTKKLNYQMTKNTIYLGSDYGGWTFVNDKRLNNQIIISAGLGLDASFDIELINKHNCKIICVDPTPSAINYYNKIIENKGRKKSKSYKDGGTQEIGSYDLTNINEKNFILIKHALYNFDNKYIKFYSPPNKNHASYSINNWQNNYSKNTNSINVSTITVKSLMKKYNIRDIQMIKLDIEGAQNEVIKNMIRDKIFPNQILVEFDEMNNINEFNTKKFFEVHDLLISKDYLLIENNNRFPDMLYVKKDF